MFNNIGKKIKVLAKVVCWIGIVLSFAIGLLIMFGASILQDMGLQKLASKGDLFGLLVMVFGTLVSWIGSFYTYGFGELIDTNQELAQSVRNLKNGSVFSTRSNTQYHPAAPVSQNTPKPAAEPVVPIPDSSDEGFCFCPVCNQRQKAGLTKCFRCGSQFVQ